MLARALQLSRAYSLEPLPKSQNTLNARKGITTHFQRDFLRRLTVSQNTLNARKGITTLDLAPIPPTAPQSEYT